MIYSDSNGSSIRFGSGLKLIDLKIGSLKKNLMTYDEIIVNDKKNLKKDPCMMFTIKFSFDCIFIYVFLRIEGNTVYILYICISHK